MVYTMAKRVNPSINAISTLIVLLITIILILINIVPALRKNIEKKRLEDPIIYLNQRRMALNS